jgi:thiamine biosynthesis lipoprotein
VPVEQLSDTMVATTRAMASAITINVPRPHGDDKGTQQLMQRSLRVFHDVEVACTRFNPSSPLMRTNATPTRWHRVPPVLFSALREAYAAHQRTGGVFDPRVLGDLVSLGYDESLRFGGDEIRLDVREIAAPRQRSWQPRFRSLKNGVWLGDAVELGGIGKGLAVRWASAVLAEQLSNYLVEAGGDCYLAGRAPDGEFWRVGVEDPFGASTPVAVLALSNRAVATSSTRLRHWRVDDQPVHHLIDPRTGRSGGEGMVAVTVVGADPAAAEVDAKVLFLAGRAGIAQAAARLDVAALWCDDEGRLSTSEAMKPFVIWERA